MNGIQIYSPKKFQGISVLSFTSLNNAEIDLW